MFSLDGGGPITDITEHSLTLISIIVGIGLTEMLGNLHRLIRNRRRVTWDWLPVTWAAALLLLVIKVQAAILRKVEENGRPYGYVKIM